MGLSGTEGRSEDLPDSARSLFIPLAKTVSIHGETGYSPEWDSLCCLLAGRTSETKTQFSLLLCDI